MELKEVLNEYTKTVQTYKETPFDDKIQTAELMKDMAIILSALTSYKVKNKIDWDGKCFNLVKEGMTGTAAEKIANQEFPDLDMLRQLLKAGNNILDTMRSHVSLLKSEQ